MTNDSILTMRFIVAFMRANYVTPAEGPGAGWSNQDEHIVNQFESAMTSYEYKRVLDRERSSKGVSTSAQLVVAAQGYVSTLWFDLSELASTNKPQAYRDRVISGMNITLAKLVSVVEELYVRDLLFGGDAATIDPVFTYRSVSLDTYRAQRAEERRQRNKRPLVWHRHPYGEGFSYVARSSDKPMDAYEVHQVGKQWQLTLPGGTQGNQTLHDKLGDAKAVAAADWRTR